jgi:hypothetical protein
MDEVKFPATKSFRAYRTPILDRNGQGSLARGPTTGSITPKPETAGLSSSRNGRIQIARKQNNRAMNLNDKVIIGGGRSFVKKKIQ